MAFLETNRFPEAVFRGAVRSQMFSTDIVQYGNGTEYRNKNWSYPLHSFQFPRKDNSAQIRVIQNYHMVQGGAFDGFRVKDPDDHKSTSDMASTVAATDQSIGTGDGATVAFQLSKNYTIGANTLSRVIKKPVTGTVKIAIGSQEQAQQWSVDTTTGLVTFAANKTSTITSISKAAQAVIVFSAAHTLVVNDTFYVSGVSGMTQINGLRAKVVTVNNSTTVTVDINSTTFSTYTSGGTSNTIPQSGEAVKAGFEFDIPVRFENDRLDTVLPGQDVRELPDLVLVELRL